MYASYIYSSVLHIEFQNENDLVNINKPQGSFYPFDKKIQILPIHTPKDQSQCRATPVPRRCVYWILMILRVCTSNTNTSDRVFPS